MKITRCAYAALVAVSSSYLIPTSSAFTVPISARHLIPRAKVLSSHQLRKTKPHMKMFFGNFFSGGGLYNAGIEYDNLDHPGPELASAAKEGKVLTNSIKSPNLRLATFAGGCFWGLELAYQRVPGVVYTAVGYSQGSETSPTYEQVCSGNTGHTEAVIVYYDPSECDYETLLDTFFGRVDPTTVNGQGNDYGRQYRTGIYYHSPDQEKVLRIRFEQEAKKHRRPMATELKPAAPFWPAEKYHQQYLEK
jgi:peptide-methionine (S)-S-oxide reductase